MSENFWKSVCIYTYKETVWYQKHIFLPDGILLSIGHFHNNFILLLLPEYFRVLPCWQIRAFVARITKNDYERENKE